MCCYSNYRKEFTEDALKGPSPEKDIREFVKRCSSSNKVEQNTQFTKKISVRVETCNYKENHVRCKSFVTIYFLNSSNKKALQAVNEARIYETISGTLTITAFGNSVNFFLVERVRVHVSLYESLVFEKNDGVDSKVFCQMHSGPV